MLKKEVDEMLIKVIDKCLAYYENMALKTSNNYSKKYLK
jgi:hypothetical protein